ncbi:hypothetical protein ElyMa_001236200 [Elysia marginata]|uniref:Uncharacterized protein n=1 Tax=Elysia marginata TaxID=1093978 RepID=A0AAV4I9Z7_9GAST|nr:hypothetical protein ElyMa_001236200 [Elysia marginata]
MQQQKDTHTNQQLKQHPVGAEDFGLVDKDGIDVESNYVDVLIFARWRPLPKATNAALAQLPSTGDFVNAKVNLQRVAFTLLAANNTLGQFCINLQLN